MTLKETAPRYESPYVSFVWKADGVENADNYNAWYNRRRMRASHIRNNTDYWRPTTISMRYAVPLLLPQTDVKFGPYVMGAILEGIRKPTPEGKNTILLDRGGSPTFLACFGDGNLNALDITRATAKQKNNPLLQISDGMSEIPIFEEQARRVNDRMRQRNLDFFVEGLRPENVRSMVATTAESLEFWLEHVLGRRIRRSCRPDGSITLSMPFDPNFFDFHDRVIGWPKTDAHWGGKSVFTFGPQSAPKTLEFDLSSFQAPENAAITLFRTQVRAVDDHSRIIDAYSIFAKPEPDTKELAMPNTRAGRYVDSNQNVAQRWLPDGRIWVPPRKDILDTESRQPLDALLFNTLGQVAEKWSRLFRRYVMRSAFTPESYQVASRFPESSPHTMHEMTQMATFMRRLYDEGQRIEPDRQTNIETDIATAFQHNYNGAQIAAWWGAGGHTYFDKIFPNAPLRYMRIGMPRGTFLPSSTAVVYDPVTDELDWESGIRWHNGFAAMDTEQTIREWSRSWGPAPTWKLKKGSPLAQLLWQFAMFGEHRLSIFR